MKLVAVYIDKNQEKIEQIVDGLVADLQSRGVEVLNYSCSRGVIQTPRVYIQLSTDMNKFAGRNFDVVASSVESGVIEYVLEQEERWDV